MSSSAASIAGTTVSKVAVASQGRARVTDATWRVHVINASRHPAGGSSDCRGIEIGNTPPGTPAATAAGQVPLRTRPPCPWRNGRPTTCGSHRTLHCSEGLCRRELLSAGTYGCVSSLV